MKFPSVVVGDVVCITTVHNETQDDLHFGIVVAVPDDFHETGMLEATYIRNSWHGVQRHTFKYNWEFTGWDTWRLTEECTELNKRRMMFTHSSPPKDFRKQP